MAITSYVWPSQLQLEVLPIDGKYSWVKCELKFIGTTAILQLRVNGESGTTHIEGTGNCIEKIQMGTGVMITRVVWQHNLSNAFNNKFFYWSSGVNIKRYYQRAFNWWLCRACIEGFYSTVRNELIMMSWVLGRTLLHRRQNLMSLYFYKSSAPLSNNVSHIKRMESVIYQRIQVESWYKDYREGQDNVNQK